MDLTDGQSGDLWFSQSRGHLCTVEPSEEAQMSTLALDRPAMVPAVTKPAGAGTAFVRGCAGRLLSGISVGLNVAVCALAIVALLA